MGNRFKKVWQASLSSMQECYQQCTFTSSQTGEVFKVNHKLSLIDKTDGSDPLWREILDPPLGDNFAKLF